MRKAITVIICLVLLGFGLIRMGVGSALLAQEFGVIHLDAFIAPLEDTERFLSKGSESAFFSFTTQSYLAYIIAMGTALSMGAIGAFRSRGWGHSLIGLYLAMHAALFANYQTINPKIAYLGIGILMLLVLIWARPKPAE